MLKSIDCFHFLRFYQSRYPKVRPRPPGYRTVPRPGRRAATWTTTVPPSAWTARAAGTVRRQPAVAEVPATVRQHSRGASKLPQKYCSAQWTPYRPWSKTTSCTGKSPNDRDRCCNDRFCIITVRRHSRRLGSIRDHTIIPGGGRRSKHEVWYFHLFFFISAKLLLVSDIVFGLHGARVKLRNPCKNNTSVNFKLDLFL